MKGFVALVIVLLIAGGVYWFMRGKAGSPPSTFALPAQTAVASHPNNWKPLPQNFVLRSDWYEYREAQKRVFAEDPQLAAEYKSLLQEMAAQQKELEAAMLKADPNVAPILAKLDQMRQRNMTPSATR